VKIAIATSGKTLEAPFAPHFGRAENFIIFDTITKAWDVYPNPALNSKRNLGFQAARFIANHDVQVAISGDFGPNAVQVLSRAGIRMFSAAYAICKILADYEEGQLREVIPSSEPGFQPQEILPDPVWEGY